MRRLSRDEIDRVQHFMGRALRRGLKRRRVNYWVNQASRIVRGSTAAVIIMPREFSMWFNKGRNPPAFTYTFILDARKHGVSFGNPNCVSRVQIEE